MSGSVSALLAPVQAAYSTYGPLANATALGEAAIVSAVSTAITGVTAIAAAANIPAGSPGGTVAGGSPVAMAASLTAQAALMTNGAVAQNVLPVLQRIQINLNAPVAMGS